MSATNSVFEMSDSFFFDPQLHYAQVLAEARKNNKAVSNSSSSSPPQLKHPPLIADVSCFSGERQKCVDGLKKTKRCWKKSLFFWRKWEGEKKNKAEMYCSARGSKQKSVSGPIYMINNLQSRSSSGPLIPTFNTEEAEIPYTLLNHPIPLPQPLYLIT